MLANCHSNILLVWLTLRYVMWFIANTKLLLQSKSNKWQSISVTHVPADRASAYKAVRCPGHTDDLSQFYVVCRGRIAKPSNQLVVRGRWGEPIHGGLGRWWVVLSRSGVEMATVLCGYSSTLLELRGAVYHPYSSNAVGWYQPTYCCDEKHNTFSFLLNCLALSKKMYALSKKSQRVYFFNRKMNTIVPTSQDKR